jgi:hypothetical protein
VELGGTSIPNAIEAIVILPEHLYANRTLQSGDPNLLGRRERTKA